MSFTPLILRWLVEPAVPSVTCYRLLFGRLVDGS